jgi:hypothetical protein
MAGPADGSPDDGADDRADDSAGGNPTGHTGESEREDAQAHAVGVP